MLLNTYYELLIIFSQTMSCDPYACSHIKDHERTSFQLSKSLSQAILIHRHLRRATVSTRYIGYLYSFRDSFPFLCDAQTPSEIEMHFVLRTFFR
jgi:hypothetical protein